MWRSDRSLQKEAKKKTTSLEWNTLFVFLPPEKQNRQKNISEKHVLNPLILVGRHDRIIIWCASFFPSSSSFLPLISETGVHFPFTSQCVNCTRPEEERQSECILGTQRWQQLHTTSTSTEKSFNETGKKQKIKIKKHQFDAFHHVSSSFLCIKKTKHAIVFLGKMCSTFILPCWNQQHISDSGTEK